MSPTDTLRILWTGGTGVGTAVMLALLREVRTDRWAIEQVRRPGLDILRQVTAGEVQDQEVRLVAIGTLFLAGVLSYLMPRPAKPRTRRQSWATPLVTGLFCVSAVAQVWLGVIKLRRRRRILLGLQLNRAKKPG